MNGHLWSPASIARLRELYSDTPTKKLAKLLKHPTCSVYGKAAALGLKKSPAALPVNGKTVALSAAGIAHRFKPGLVPWNKGRKGWRSGGRSAEYYFKKGHFPFNRDPEFYVIGALRVNSDGYVDMRISFAHGAKGWRGLHLILWEDAHGPVPKGFNVQFKDRDRMNVVIENLELVSKADNMRRNTVHNLPAPLARTINLLGQLKRRIREKQNGRPAQPSVRDA